MHHAALLRKPGTVDTRTFFDDVCPTSLKLRTAGEGRVGFFIRGRKGGSWVVDLAAQTVQVGFPKSSVDLIVSMSDTDFDRLLMNKLDAARGLSDGTIELAGDTSLLRTISALFR